MKKILLLIVFVTFSSFGQGANLKKYNKFLKAHVDKTGFVDYEKVLKHSDDLDEIIKDYAKTTPNGAWSPNEKKAYWINLYNISMIKFISQNFPIKSINYVPDAFKTEFIQHAGKKLSLDHIQHDIVRTFSDPRIHFALYSSGKSSPRLRNVAYSAETLETDLGVATSEYLNDNDKNVIPTENQEIVLISQIFDWYKKDFEASYKSIREFVNEFSYRKIEPNSEIQYADFDWNLRYKK